jgi:hypothetical protein
MAGNPAMPQPPSGAPKPGAPPDSPSQPAERYGIVALARHLKDDGRRLLLYTREESDPK